MKDSTLWHNVLNLTPLDAAFSALLSNWQTVGLVSGCLLLLVAHTVHVDEDEIIRIVSARRADPTERKNYEHG